MRANVMAMAVALSGVVACSTPPQTDRQAAGQQHASSVDSPGTHAASRTNTGDNLNVDTPPPAGTNLVPEGAPAKATTPNAAPTPTPTASPTRTPTLTPTPTASPKPVAAPVPAATAQRPTTNRPEQAAKRLFDFSRSADAAAFRSVDDRVMGGVSRSSLQPTGAATAVFAGDLSLKQNGGFASVRASDLKLDVSAAEGIVVRVRGDGNIYKLRVADKPGFNAIAYQSAFVAPAGQWREIRLPFADFIPVWRGRRVRDASPLDRSSIRRMGVMISDKQEGRFRLELAWVGVY